MTFRGVVCLRGKIFALSYGGKCTVQRLDTLVGGKYLHIEDTSDLNIAPLNASVAASYCTSNSKLRRQRKILHVLDGRLRRLQT
jgi:hypothetical protein